MAHCAPGDDGQADRPGARERARRRGRARRRSRLALAAAVAVLAALVALALTKLNWARVVGTLSDLAPGWTVLAVALVIASFVLRAESWFVVIRAAVRTPSIGRPVVCRATVIGMAGSTIMPARLGEPARAWIIARRVGNPAQAVAIIVGTLVSQTLLNLLALYILAAIALAGAAVTGARLKTLLATLALPVAILTILYAGPRVLRVLARSRSLRLRRVAQFAVQELLHVRLGLVVFRRPSTAAHATGAQLSAWALQLGTCYALLLALGLRPHQPLAAAAGVLVAVNLTAIVPATPANVGVFQAACIVVLSRFGVGAGPGLAYGLVLQAIEAASALALAAPALLREGISWAELRAHTT